LLAGPAPSHTDREVQKARLRALLDAGVRCFVDLTTPAEIPVYRVAAERLAAAGDEPAYLQIPVPNGTAPNAHTAKLVLDVIDVSVRADRAVYVHCLGGLGRTGTLVGCWLVRHGLADPSNAIERLSELRRGQPSCERPSPETPEQRRLLHSWRRGL
jgi:protein-tyrosine phosphatase